MPKNPRYPDDPLKSLCFDLGRLGAATIGTPRGTAELMLQALAWFAATILIDVRARDPATAEDLHKAFMAVLGEYVQAGDCALRPGVVPPERRN